MECAARIDLMAATDAERGKETHYRVRTSGTMFVPLASRGCAGSGPSTSMFCAWFRHRVSIVLQRSLAHVIHARFLRREESVALLPPPLSRALLSPSE